MHIVRNPPGSDLLSWNPQKNFYRIENTVEWKSICDSKRLGKIYLTDTGVWDVGKDSASGQDVVYQYISTRWSQKILQTIWRFIIKAWKTGLCSGRSVKRRMESSIIQKIRMRRWMSIWASQDFWATVLARRLQPVIGQMQWSRKSLWIHAFISGASERVVFGNGDRTDYAGSGKQEKGAGSWPAQKRKPWRQKRFWNCQNPCEWVIRFQKRFMRKSKHSLKRSRAEGWWMTEQKRQPVCCSMCCVSGSCIWREPEMVAFITELNANYYSVWFIKENGSDAYYRYNKGFYLKNGSRRSSGRWRKWKHC